MQIAQLINTYIQSSPRIQNAINPQDTSSNLFNHYQALKTYFALKLKSKDIVAIYLPKNQQYIITMFALANLGITFIPLNKSFPESRTSDMLKLGQVTHIVCDESDDFMCQKFADYHYLQYEDICVTDYDAKAEDIFYTGNPLYIIFTSGSTGKPKGVIISRLAYENFLDNINSEFNFINKQDTILNIADFTFDLSMLDIALMLTRNVNLIVSNFSGNIFQIATEIEKYGITTIATVPNNFNLLYSDTVLKRAKLSSIKNLLIGGSRFSYGLYEKLKKYAYLNLNIYNMYGPTEATVYCTMRKIQFDEDEEINQKIVTVGKAYKKCEIHILDEHSRSCQNYESGELYIAGSQLMNGYIGLNEQSKNVLPIINGKPMYKTGDLAFIDTNGNLFIRGRLDDTVKVKGYRINLSDIDSIIQSIGGIIECATIAIEDEQNDNYLVLFVHLNSQQTLQEIKEKLIDFLPDYQRPTEIFQMEDFPLNTSGKISKKILKEDIYTKVKQ